MEKAGSILRSIFDSTDDVWFFIAADYSILYFNEKARNNAKIFHNRELKAGDNIIDYAKDTRNQVDQAFKQAFERALNGEILKEEKEIVYNDLSAWFESKYVPVYHDDHLAGISVTVSDITSQKLMEQEREKDRKEIAALLNKREDFMSIASHELKTPVTGIKGFLQILKRQAVQDGNLNYENLLNKAAVQVNKLTAMINELLDISRIDSGKLRLEYTSFDLGALIDDCVFILQPISSRHNIKVIDGHHIELWADRSRMEQVICNLLSNAIKYSPEGSTVTLQTSIIGNNVEIKVADQGIGISNEKLDLLFDRFYRVDESNVAKSGLGLGLYISRDIIERHNGRITVESKVGQGSEFKVLLPYIKYGV
jgi:two-component system, chemotaxis family, CheB/CheR fusion protein